jgi:Fe-S-cluster containining protein
MQKKSPPEAFVRQASHRWLPHCFTLRAMTAIPLLQLPAEPVVTCSTCAACCCQLEVMLITDTGVPERFIDTDDWGGEVMLRLDDGWCAALDRDTMLCTIYDKRPLICREFEMGAPECITEREGIATAYL